MEHGRPSAFISYQRADVSAAEILSGALSAEGVDAWWDARIPKGDDWRERIVEALSGCDIVILLHSGAAEKSAEVRNELAVASALRKPVIAVQLEDRPPSGAFLYEMARFNWVPAFGNVKGRLEELASQVARLDPNASPGSFAAAINAKRRMAPLLLRLINSNLLIAAVWIAAVAGGLAAHNLMGEGLESMATERGITLTDITYAALAIIIGAPLFLIRFALTPPASGAEWALLACAILIVVCYMLLVRNGLKWIGRTVLSLGARRRGKQT